MMEQPDEPREVVEYVVLKGVSDVVRKKRWEIGEHLTSTDFTRVQISNLLNAKAIKREMTNA